MLSYIVDRWKLLLKYVEQYIIECMDLEDLENPQNVFFKDLVELCTRYFGEPRIRGSHHIFRTGFKDNPMINLQPRKSDKKMAVPYQVRQVKKILNRLKEEDYGTRY